MGFDTFQTNLLAVPAYLLFICQLLLWTWVSERLNQRFLVGVVSQVWAFPLIAALEFLPGDANIWTKYVLTALLVGHPYVHAILVAITSRNAGTVRTRTVASALYNMSVQASSIVAQNVSWPSESITHSTDVPRYTVTTINRSTGGQTKF
jgi:hypothetical protein